MNADYPTPPMIPTIATAGDSSAVCQTPAATQPEPSSRRRALFTPVKFLLGMVMCNSILPSIAVVGWASRFMQRTTLKQWWLQSDLRRQGISFAEFLATDTATRTHLHWPNWLLEQNFRETIRRRPETSAPAHALFLFKNVFASLWNNLRLGVQTLFNVWVFTLPGCAMMAFGWYDGWQNSFNKGYETYYVGILISWIGIVSFIAAMFYVPMASARQASAGRWTAFYDFALIRRLIRRNRISCLALAGFYALASFPMMVLLLLPFALPTIPGMTNFTDQQAVASIKAIYFLTTALVLPLFIFLRWLAARIYARALLQAVQSGAIAEDSLGELEWQAFHRLNLMAVQSSPARHPVVQVIGWMGGRVAGAIMGFAAAFLWLLLVAQTYVATFLNYNGPFNFLNRPMVQLPWLKPIPVRLENPWSEAAAAAGVLFLGWVAFRLVRFARRLRR